MITNFEEITAPLTDDEKMIILRMEGLLKDRYYENPIKAPDLVKLIKRETFLMRPFSEVRLRKMVNFIRVNGLLPLIATSKGYFLSNDKNVIEGEIKSLEERAEAIWAAARGLKSYLIKAEQLNLFEK